jgi:hypothetical protein
VSYDPAVVDWIRQAAKQTGADPAWMLATSLVESGARRGAVGDQGTSFGPFQHHRGGALGSNSPEWANSIAAVQERARHFAKMRIRSGAGAASLQRPANPVGYATKVDSAYAQAVRILEGLGVVAPVEGNEPDVGGVAAAGGLGAAPSSPGSLVERTTQPGLDDRRFELLQGVLDNYSKTTGTRGYQLPRAAARTSLEEVPAPAADGSATGAPSTDAAPTASASASKGRMLGGEFSVGGGQGQGTHSRGEGPDNWQSDNAVDLMAPKGTPIYATVGGIVSPTAGFGAMGPASSRFGGSRLTIQAEDGNEHYFAHLSSYAKGIRPGARITPGQLIGYVGTANGVDHLHYAVRDGDPRRYAR